MSLKPNTASVKSLEIAKIKNSDIEFFEKLFKRYYQPLVNFAYRYVQDAQLAEDIIHDVFVYLWNERERLDFTINIKTYLYNAVKNRSLKQLSKKAVKQHQGLEIVLEEQGDDTPETLLMSKELQESISAAINELPEKRREIFCMNRFDQLTYAEIASILNISVKTVETQMSRALKFLRHRLSQFLTLFL